MGCQISPNVFFFDEVSKRSDTGLQPLLAVPRHQNDLAQGSSAEGSLGQPALRFESILLAAKIHFSLRKHMFRSLSQLRG